MSLPIAIGAMRLSEVDEPLALETLRAALEAGARWIVTGAAYGRDEHDAHGNERLIGRASTGVEGVEVITKVGLVREARGYRPDGRARTIREELERSREALGVAVLAGCLLHAIDPKTPFTTSVRALAELREAGLVRRIGVANVTRAELDRALEVTAIDLVEVEVSPFVDRAARGSVLSRCAELGIPVLAHSPLGGPKRASRLAKHKELVEVATRLGVSPAQVAVAWLRASGLVPIPGPRNPIAAREIVAAARIALAPADLARLPPLRRSDRRDRESAFDPQREVVLLMGSQGAGKSTLARQMEREGYLRLNRDDRGGSLRGLSLELDRALAGGTPRLVLDNTYASRADRADVIAAARAHRVPVRCVHVEVPAEIALANTARRAVEALGRLPTVEELEATRADPRLVPPRALFRYRRALEPPSADEGFSTIEVRRFERQPEHGDGTARIVALEVIGHFEGDGHGTFVLDREKLARALANGPIDVVGWAPLVEAGARDIWARELSEALREGDRRLAHGASSLELCVHGAGPPRCWCRPPLPGLAVLAMSRRRAPASRTVIVGSERVYGPIARGLGAELVASS